MKLQSFKNILAQSQLYEQILREIILSSEELDNLTLGEFFEFLKKGNFKGLEFKGNFAFYDRDFGGTKVRRVNTIIVGHSTRLEGNYQISFVDIEEGDIDPAGHITITPDLIIKEDDVYNIHDQRYQSTSLKEFLYLIDIKGMKKIKIRR